MRGVLLARELAINYRKCLRYTKVLSLQKMPQEFHMKSSLNIVNKIVLDFRTVTCLLISDSPFNSLFINSSKS